VAAQVSMFVGDVVVFRLQPEGPLLVSRVAAQAGDEVLCSLLSSPLLPCSDDNRFANGSARGRQKMNDGQIPNVRGVRVHVSTGYNPEREIGGRRETAA
jgi:hypothetical protein